MKGYVKFFNERKGFGFITAKDSQQEFFVHVSGLIDRIRQDDNVDFTVTEDKRGKKAINVRLDNNDANKLKKDEELLAIGVFGDKIKMVSLLKDGTYQYLDTINNYHNILYILTSETLLLEHALEEFEYLINNDRSSEEDFQNFFERYPEFILNDSYKKAHPHVVLTKEDGDKLIPDFVLEPIEQNSLCDLLDIKLPNKNIYVLKKNRTRFSSAIFEVCAQLREYKLFFDEENNRKKIKEKYGLLAYKPKMFVIIGRRGTINPIDIRNMETDIPELKINTYDDLMHKIKIKIDSMKSGFKF